MEFKFSYSKIQMCKCLLVLKSTFLHRIAIGKFMQHVTTRGYVVCQQISKYYSYDKCAVITSVRNNVLANHWVIFREN